MPERRIGKEPSTPQGGVGDVQPPPDVWGWRAREEDVELCERPPGRQPPAGKHERRARQGSVGRGVPCTRPPTDR